MLRCVLTVFGLVTFAVGCGVSRTVIQLSACDSVMCFKLMSKNFEYM